MTVKASDHEVVEFDEEHREYLVMRELKLIDIVKLAHLVSPAKWSGLLIPAEKSIVVTPHFAALKNEAIYGRIKCEHKRRPGGIIDHAALISLTDLLTFLTTAGPEWDWLRKFAERWRRYCRAELVPKNSGRPDKLERPKYDLTEVTRAYRQERSQLQPFPTEILDGEWFNDRFPGLQRKIWREIRKPFLPEDCQNPGPRKKSRRLDC
jgi:hypothetical protein